MNDLSIKSGRAGPGAIRVGPAGWSYKDWDGVVYPKPGSRFDALEYLSGFFDTIEINSSFYRIPPARNAASWVRRVANNDAFRFTAKLYRGFTHERDGGGETDVRAFRDFVAPMADAGRLGAVLAQFPWSFRATRRARERLTRLFEKLDGMPLVVEVRHGSFEIERFFRFLDEHDVGFANIDQPVIGESIRPTSIVTGPVAYVRLHGRNYEKWFDHDEGWQRYDYLYPREELDSWIEKIETMSHSRDVYVVTNNHFRGQAIVNAIEIERGLGRDPDVPPALLERYGERLRR